MLNSDLIPRAAVLAAIESERKEWDDMPGKGDARMTCDYVRDAVAAIPGVDASEVQAAFLQLPEGVDAIDAIYELKQALHAAEGQRDRLAAQLAQANEAGAALIGAEAPLKARIAELEAERDRLAVHLAAAQAAW